MARTVLIDLTSLDTPTRVRGIGRYLKNLAQGLGRLTEAQRGGLRLLALTGLSWSGKAQVTEDLGAFGGSLQRAGLSKADHYRWAYRRRVALWRAVRQVGADLVHLGDPNATPLAMGLTGCKRVVTCHDVIPFRFPERYLGIKDGYGLIGKQLIRRRYGSADHVVAISDATREDLIHLIGIEPGKISRVYNGVDLERWCAHGTELDGASLVRLGLASQPYLVYVGDTDWRKNVDGMLAGLGWAKRLGTDVSLVFVGKLEPEKQEHIRRLALLHGVEPAVRLLGFVSDQDLGALFRGAIAHLFVSRAEGFGFTVVEAMGCGCPVITTHQGSLSEVAGEAALVVDPEAPQAIGQAICRLTSDPELRRQLGEKGQARAQRFSHEAQALGMIDVFQKVLG